MTPQTHPQPTDAAADPRSPFQKFQDLTRRILTTPKAELVKDAPPKSAKPRKRK